MPERIIRARGGAVRWRSKCIDGELYRVAVVAKPGPRGGHTVVHRTHKRCK